MARRTRFHDWRPTDAQELLLSAALSPGPEAAASLAAWQQRNTGAPLDVGTQRLLPLLHHNLKANGILYEGMEVLKREYLDAWARNQVLLARLPRILGPLADAGIRTMVLKGTSLIPRFYKDMGLRPMKDLDVLIPTNRISDALDVLSSVGWMPERKRDRTFGRYVSVNHGLRFWDKSSAELDLHWHVLNECLAPDADDDFWADAVPLELSGVRTLSLSATHELLHTCVHGVRWNPVAPVRWIADAHAILQARPQINWSEIVVQARKRRLTLTIRTALQYLRDEFRMDIPEAITQELARSTISRQEMLEWSSRLHRPGWTLSTPPFLWAHYPRIARDTGRPPTIFGFIGYLQAVWDLDHLWQVPVFAAARNVERLLNTYRH